MILYSDTRGMENISECFKFKLAMPLGTKKQN